MRTALLALAIACASVAGAQGYVDVIRAGIRTLQDREILPRQDQQNPMQPSGLPLPPVKRAGDLPQPSQVGPEGGGLQVLKAGDPQFIGTRVKVTGGVEFTNRGYHVWADEVDGDRATDVYTMRGNVIVVGADESIYGEVVTVNFRDETFVAEEAESTLKPTLVKGRLRDNLYVRAKRSAGSQREVFGDHTSTTTCSYPDPHYEIAADKTDVRPGRRVIFRKVRLRILGNTVLTLPYLSIPLDERNYNNLPQVGQGRQEGYFVKTRWGIPLSGDDVLNSRLDYYTKLGLGLGGDYQYNNRTLRGSLRTYAIIGQQNQFEIAGNHRQEFGWANLTLDNSFSKNNYLTASGSTLWSSRAVLQVPQGRSSSRLTFFRNSSEYQSSSGLQQTLSLNDTRVWNARLRSNFDINLGKNESRFTGGNPVKREQVDIRLNSTADLGKAQARLDYIRSIPIGETTGFFGQSDVTPAISLLSDSRRLFGDGFDRTLPFRTELSLGEYGDPISRGRISRSNFTFDFNNPRTSQGRLQVNWSGGFKQSLYSDDTAQYILRGGSQITYRFTRDTAFNIRYNYLRPYGYTPLQIDRSGRTNVVTSDILFSPYRNLYLGAQSGYDLNLLKQGTQTPWQQVGLRAEYRLGQLFNFRALSTYDTTRHTFSTNRFDLVYVPGSTFFSIGAKYDGLRHTWAAVNIFVDGLQFGRLRTSALLNYNGYLKKFEAQHYSFIYDLHCAEAVFQIIDNPSGFNGGRQFYFFVRLKALPFDTPFGTGQRGQPIGTGTGRDN